MAKQSKNAPAAVVPLSTSNPLGLPAVGTSIVPPPEEIRFAPPSVDEQRRAAVPVLVAARALVKSGSDMLSAIAEAGRGGIVCEYARRAVRTVLKEWNLLAWQEHPARKRADVFQAIDRALVLCQRKDHRGGWFVAPRPGGRAA